MAQDGARFDAAGLPTPALVVDATAFERNVDAMAARARRHGMALRPHAKTHKSPAVAQRQLAAGAVGLSVATVGEAEVFAAAGAPDIFIAYPVWPHDDIGGRLRTLADRTRLSLGTDCAEAVGALAAAGLAGRVALVVEVDCGLGRSGVAPAGAGAVASAAADAGFEMLGVFTFPGHSYGPGRAAPAAADERRALTDATHAVQEAGLACELTSGGSTPSAAASSGPVPAELRPGVYVFNDAQQVALGTCDVAGVALSALATVVSTAGPGRVVLDAGAKVLGPDRPPWLDTHGLLPGHPGAVVTGLWEHHAVVDVSALPASQQPALGERVAIVPNHVCSAVNLAPALHVVHDGRVVDTWEVTARGKNR